MHAARLRGIANTQANRRRYLSGMQHPASVIDSNSLACVRFLTSSGRLAAAARCARTLPAAHVNPAPALLAGAVTKRASQMNPYQADLALVNGQLLTLE